MSGKLGQKKVVIKKRFRHLEIVWYLLAKTCVS